MNFFKSILSDDPDAAKAESPQDSDPDEDHGQDNVVEPNAESSASGGGSIWGFGGLIQTLASRSESVLETYRRDLQEFGSGLRKETDLFREVAGRAVKELPASIEVAHGAIDGVIKSTADIISHSTETLIAQSSDDVAPPETPERNITPGRYSWFESQLTAIQNDVNTFCEDPDDLGEYNKWKSGFMLTEKSEEIEDLIGGNGALEGMYRRVVVANEVDHETFWYRYFYRVDKLKQQESVRAKLVKRAISIDDDEEELTWDFDDEDDAANENNHESHDLKQKDDESNQKELGQQSSNKDVEEKGLQNVSAAEEGGEKQSSVGNEHEISDLKMKGDESDKKESGDKNPNKNVADESMQNVIIDKGSGENKASVDKGDDVVSSGEGVSVSSVEKLKSTASSQVKNEEKIPGLEESSQVKNGDKMAGVAESSKKENAEKVVQLEAKSDQGGLNNDGAVSGVSSQQSVPEEEEDLSWDEIEDSESNDEKNISNAVGNANRVDVRKRLSTAEEDEDLSWDIEDDD